MPELAHPLLSADSRDALTRLAVDAARLILSTSAAARIKPDGSPVTDADVAAEAHLLAGIQRILPGLPCIAEESVGAAPPGSGPFALVDPLDGTREFIAGRAEYTVNLALIAEGRPAWGVVVAPALGVAWRGGPGLGAQRVAFDAQAIAVAASIRTRAWPATEAIALVSRSHADPVTAAFLRRVPDVTQVACGSALKFCRIAEGAADLYPRLAPTMEWDVAAGHALVEGAGGIVVAADGSPLRYGHTDAAYRVSGFVAWGDRSAGPRSAALAPSG